MSRINTNISSLVSQYSLGRSYNDQSQALLRLSTGLRINSGKDDPAGLIASENLGRDITAAGEAVSNSERAAQMIATADSSLGQVSKLLNDIRGLITEAANEGALSDEQIAANQLQVDSSLEAIDRISKVTAFQGRKLLDGSLDFAITGSTNYDRISNLQVTQANLGSANSLDIEINVATAATQAQVDITNVPAATAAVNAFQDVSLSHLIDQASGAVSLTASGFSFSLAADAGGQADGADGNLVDVVLSDAAASASYNALTNQLAVSVDITGGATVQDIVDAINNNVGVDFTAAVVAAGAVAAGDADTYSNPMTGGRDAGSATVRVTADTAGVAANGVTVTLAEDGTIPVNTAVASIDASGDIDVAINGTVSYAAIATAIDGLTGYSAAVTASTGDQNYVDTLDTPPGVATLGGGVDAGGGLAQDAVFQLSGKDGSEVFAFSQGTSITQLASAINVMSAATGVSATVNSTTLELMSTDYGSAAYVDVKVISEAPGGTVRAAVGEGTRDTGDDVEATVNGIEATGRGNMLSLNSTTLDLQTEVDAGFTGTVEFTIDGGGALFQLGPSVTPNQQSRIGITSVSTATLGGSSGRLYQLRSGEEAALDTDTTLAAQIVDEVITKAVELRGRLGAFQRTTLETNIAALKDTIVNLTEAKSAIQDADFASETAALTRAQILVQSGTAVLTIANQNPQNVLALLR